MMKNYQSHFEISALVGLWSWVLTWFIPSLYLIERLFLLAPLAIVPLALSLIIQSDREGQWPLLIKILAWTQPFGAFSVLLSLLWPPGLIAGLLATGWLIVTTAIACFGIQYLIFQGLGYIEEFSISMGLLFLPVGGCWFFAYRMGIQPLGFSGVIVLLTGVHFHYAGFSAPILNGLAGRFLLKHPQSKFLKNTYILSTLAILIGIPILAMGITFSPLLELLAAFILAFGLILLSLQTLFKMIPLLSSKPSKILLAISSLAIWLTMLCALLYAVGEFTGQVLISIPQMAQLHGISNALGFVGCGLIAWYFNPTKPRAPQWGIPFSQFRGRGFIGPGFFQNIQAVPSHIAHHPTGLIDDMNVYEQHDLLITKLHPDIIAFYEHTEDFELLVQPQWQVGFKLGGKYYHKLMTKIGQMCLPIQSEKLEDQMSSQILPLDDQMDGRQSVRAWVRTYSQTSKAVYVAAYSSHINNSQRYMNIAFPLPFSNMSSILRLDPLDNGLILTTLSRDNFGDQGVYWVFPWFPLRLPLNETIQVWSGTQKTPLNHHSQMDKVQVLARHDMWLFGLKFLTLEYYIYPLQKT